MFVLALATGNVEVVMVGQLHRVEPGSGGIGRKGAGSGFIYVTAKGKRIRAEGMLEHIAELAIPPAWNEVWIAADPRAHIQATGVDDAGRTQYLYHPQWRQQREEEKFIRSLVFAQRLPALRRAVTRDLRQLQDPRRQALAAAVRIIDRAGLRVGGATYAEENGSFGATTLQRRHVSVTGSNVHLVFRGKSAGRWDIYLNDSTLAGFLQSVPNTPRKSPALCHAVLLGRRKTWHPITDTEVNAYLGEVVGDGFTAKDFRTWQGSVKAALSLARSYRAGVTSPKAVTLAIKEASQWLHNTPAVARDSYVDPRIVSLFEQGKVASLNRQHDSAVVALLTGRR